MYCFLLKPRKLKSLLLLKLNYSDSEYSISHRDLILYKLSDLRDKVYRSLKKGGLSNFGEINVEKGRDILFENGLYLGIKENFSWKIILGRYNKLESWEERFLFYDNLIYLFRSVKSDTYLTMDMLEEFEKADQRFASTCCVSKPEYKQENNKLNSTFDSLVNKTKEDLKEKVRYLVGFSLNVIVLIARKIEPGVLYLTNKPPLSVTLCISALSFIIVCKSIQQGMYGLAYLKDKGLPVPSYLTGYVPFLSNPIKTIIYMVYSIIYSIDYDASSLRDIPRKAIKQLSDKEQFIEHVRRSPWEMEKTIGYLEELARAVSSASYVKYHLQSSPTVTPMVAPAPTTQFRIKSADNKLGNQLVPIKNYSKELVPIKNYSKELVPIKNYSRELVRVENKIINNNIKALTKAPSKALVPYKEKN